MAISMVLLAVLLHGGGSGVAIYLVAVLVGIVMAAAFSPLMTRVLLRVPAKLAADAVVVTVNQLE